MDIESARFTLWNKTPPAFDGTLGVQARDLDPVLKALAEKDVISELIPHVHQPEQLPRLGARSRRRAT